MSRGRSTPEAIKLKVVEFRSEGASFDRIAYVLGISVRNVSRILSPEKTLEKREWSKQWVRGKRRGTQGLEVEMSRLRKEGQSYRAIATELGLNETAVIRYLSPYSKRRQKDRRFNEIRITHNGKYIRVRAVKRPYPEGRRCEICNIPGDPSLHWHHWDDGMPSKGIWVCFRCHMFCEGIEKGLTVEHLKRYLEIRERENVKVHS